MPHSGTPSLGKAHVLWLLAFVGLVVPSGAAPLTAFEAAARAARLRPDLLPGGLIPTTPPPPSNCSTSKRRAVHIRSDQACPPECPYSQPLEGVSCEKVCIEGDLCPKFHPARIFADPLTMTCEPACSQDESLRISGCEECAAPGICKRCGRGLFGITALELSEDGKHCVNHAKKWWYLGYSILGVIVASMALYIVSVMMRDPAEGNVLEVALKKREAARTELMADDGEDYGLLTTNVHLPNTPDDQQPRRLGVNNLGGCGVALYFNTLVFGVVIALVLLCGGFFAFELSDLGRSIHEPVNCTLNTGHHSLLLHQHSTEILSREPRPSVQQSVADYADHVIDTFRAIGAPVEAARTRGVREKYEQYHRRMFHTLLVLYVLILIMSWAFTAWQLFRVTSKFDGKEPSMKDFAVLVSGLPANLTDGRKVTEHFRKHMEAFAAPLYPGKEDDFTVVGTSIAYDFYDIRDEVAREISKFLEEVDEYSHPEIHHSTSSDLQSDKVSPSRFVLEGLQEKTRKAPNYFFDSLPMALVGLRDEPQITMRNSGRAFVVLNSRLARDTLVDSYKAGKLQKFEFEQEEKRVNIGNARRAGSEDKALSFNFNSLIESRRVKREYKLTIEPAPCDPISIYWENLSHWVHFPHKVALGVLAILGTILLWVLLYIPYAINYADLIVIPGMRPDMVQDACLGGMIAVGNAVLAVVIDKAVNWAGHKYKDVRDSWVLAFAFIGTLLNTVFDLSTVAVMAKGLQIQNAFEDRDTSYDTVMAEEIYGLIVPGYLIIPYLGMPLVEHIVPFFLSYYLIRSHARIAIGNASEALRCPEFDICWRYSDILNNTTICVFLLLFTSPTGYKVMFFLGFFMLLIYGIDKILLLKYTTPLFYDTHRLYLAFACWWAVPTALLVGIVTYWGMKANAFDRDEWWMFIMIPILHIAVYLTGIFIIQDQFERKKKTSISYRDAVSRLRKNRMPWDFFNTNPIFCLRTKVLGAEDSGWKEVTEALKRGGEHDEFGAPELCVPFVRGTVNLCMQPRPVGEA